MDFGKLQKKQYNNKDDMFFYGIDKNNRQIMLLSLLSLLLQSDIVWKNVQVCVLSRWDELYELLNADFSILQKKFPNHKLNIKNIQQWDVSHIPIAKHTRPVASYLRLLVPELSKDITNSPIYLDADTIVHKYPDHTDLKNHPLWAYEEWSIALRRFRSLYDKNINWYFNSGVLYFNNEQYLWNEISNNICDFLWKYKTNLPDQDALNYALKDIGINKLSKSYNTLPREYHDDILSKVFILHYAGKKPREKQHNIPFTYLDCLVKHQNTLSDILNDTSNNKEFSYEIDLYWQTKLILKKILWENYYRLMRLKQIAYCFKR